jgi:hypothetical protein
MKILINSLRIGMIFLSLALLTSCEKKNIENSGNGAAEFSINAPDESNQAKSSEAADSAMVSFQILVTVADMEGNIVFTDKLIPLYTFGTGFVSENLEIQTGEYKLTKFMVINPSGEVVFATPVAGSPLAYLTNNPLPINFNIFPNQITRIEPEVLAVGDQTPGQFGYTSFGVQIIKPLSFWTICILDNPLIMAPTQITSAKLTVFTPAGWHYTFMLEPKVNNLIIRGGSDIYFFVVEKEGYQTQKMEFSARELMATSKESPLVLKIPWGPQGKMLVLQPGPELGKDALVSNLEPDKNFGGHKYFEATFLTEPILTVMRSNRSLIFFNLDALPLSAKINNVTLRLSYDVPVPFDSSYLNNTSVSGGFAWFGGVLQQIVEPWEEDKVTWNSQPKSIEANQVYISPFIRNVNFIDVDVTRLFVPLQEIAAPNHGMLFKLWPDDNFPGFRFASSDYPEPAMRPKLSVYYTMN